MSFDEILFDCLINFTNPDNNERQESERTFNEITEQNDSKMILSSLINIIDQNPQKVVSFSALIQLCHLLYRYLESIYLDEEFFVFLKDKILHFFTDLRFSHDMHRYLLNIITLIYISSMLPDRNPIHDIWIFFGEALQIPELYSLVLEFYQNFLSDSISPDLFDFDDNEKIQFFYSHLDSTNNQMDRAYTLNFFIKFWDKYSTILSSSDLLSILDELDDIRCFQISLVALITKFMSGTIDINVEDFFDLLYNRIIDDNYDEPFRQYCLYHFIYNICQNKLFFACFASDLQKFINMMSIITENPNKYPILYEEGVYSIKTMLLALYNTPVMIHIIYQLIEDENIYVSSLFQAISACSYNIDQNIAYISHDDQFIRQNGFRYFKKLLKSRIKEIYSISDKVVEDIGSSLLDSYEKFRDPFALRVIARWCMEVEPDTLAALSDAIMDLSLNILSFEAIQCGSELLKLNEKGYDEFASNLLQNVYQILSSDCKTPQDSNASLADLIECMPNIFNFIDMEKKIEFMNFFVPIICSDGDALFADGLEKLLLLLEENIELYEESIMDQLTIIYDDSVKYLDSSRTSSFLDAISSYGILFLNFENNYLQQIWNTCLNIINRGDSFIPDSIPNAIDTINAILKKFGNEELFNSVFESVFDFVLKSNEVYEIESYFKLIKQLIKSEYFITEKESLVIDYIKPLFDHCSDLIVDMKECGNLIQLIEYVKLIDISNYLFKIFELLFHRRPDELCQIIMSDFLDYDIFPLEVQTSIINIYLTILQDDKEYSKELSDQLIQNLLNAILMMPTEQEEYQKLENKLSFYELGTFIELQELVIKGFGNLLYVKEYNIELVDQIIEILLCIFHFENDNDFDGRSKKLQDICVFCLSLLISKYKLDEAQIDEKLADLIMLIFHWLPNSLSIYTLSFYSFFHILLFCISNEIFSDENNQEMINSMCQCISELKVEDTVLRTILRECETLDSVDAISTFIYEIQKFLN